MPTSLNDPKVEAVLSRLYALDHSQLGDLIKQPPPRNKTESGSDLDPVRRGFLKDKLVALEPEKAEFCYLQCRALGARRVVECGTSFGVSTIYLAAAIRDNANQGVVIGTEYEPEKAAAARANWAEAGLTEFIDLREGDIRETLRDCGGPVDFVLFDIWTAMARPTLEILIPQLSKGAVIVADNVDEAAQGYADFLERIRPAGSGFRAITLPFKGGFEFAVWEG